jgi:hypothetical protein
LKVYQLPRYIIAPWLLYQNRVTVPNRYGYVYSQKQAWGVYYLFKRKGNQFGPLLLRHSHIVSTQLSPCSISKLMHWWHHPPGYFICLLNKDQSQWEGGSSGPAVQRCFVGCSWTLILRNDIFTSSASFSTVRLSPLIASTNPATPISSEKRPRITRRKRFSSVS